MARKLRIEYAGAVYHVMNRGDRREEIFLTDEDRELFLETLDEACTKTGWEVFAYCLMPNHFHLVMATPRANLVAGMKWFLGTYTSRFNRRHKLFGHLFSGRYKSLVVDNGAEGYLKTVCDYVHLNPIRAKLISGKVKLSDFRWSSYGQYLQPARRWSWLKVERLLGAHGIARDTPAGRREFELRMEARRAESDSAEWKKVRRGWMLGSEEFRQELLGRMEEQVGLSHYGAELRESEEERARRIIAEEMQKRKFPVLDFGRLSKSASSKVRIARRIRAETAMPLRWIVQELQMGSIGYAARILRERSKVRD